MKKLLFILFSAIMCVSISSCNSCKGDKEVTEPTDSTNVVDTTGVLNVEHVIAMDRQDMFLNYAKDYRWYETCMKLENYLDDENCDGTVHSVSNVFQVIDEKDNGADVFVVLYSHLADTSSVDVRQGFWVEDLPMEDDVVKLTYKDAFERVMQTNSPKPHSKNCILRKPLGPQACNPQYVFGNLRAQLWVDAVTGEVRNSNPAFPESVGFKMPLGEWP